MGGTILVTTLALPPRTERTSALLCGPPTATGVPDPLAPGPLTEAAVSIIWSGKPGGW